MSNSPRRSVGRSLQGVVTAYLARKGLAKSNINRDMRQQERRCVTPNAYVYEPASPQSPEQQIISLIFKSKPLPRASPRRRTKKTLKSADETLDIVDSEDGRILIPIRDYHRALRRYKNEQVIINELHLRETEEMNRHFKRIADAISPNVKKEMKVFTRRTRPSTRLTKCSDLEEIKEVLHSVKGRTRSMTPGGY